MATAAKPRLIVPGLVPRDPYCVRRGGATVIALEPDDRLTVRDLVGGQRAEVTVLAPRGREDAAALAISSDASATVLRSLVGSRTDGADDVIRSLAARGLDPSVAAATELSGEQSPRHVEETFRAARRVVVVGAPDGTSVVEGGVPGSDLQLEIRRATPHDDLDPSLPDPLAYEVEAGEYVRRPPQGPAAVWPIAMRLCGLIDTELTESGS